MASLEQNLRAAADIAIRIIDQSGLQEFAIWLDRDGESLGAFESYCRRSAELNTCVTREPQGAVNSLLTFQTPSGWVVSTGNDTSNTSMVGHIYMHMRRLSPTELLLFGQSNE